MSRINVFFKGIRQGFNDFSNNIVNVINFVLLLIVYILGIGLVSIIMKLFGKHFLELKKENKKTNWVEHKVAKQPLEKYYRSF
ncbi:hypothetical protein CMO83_05545 [Candidatus Woesearchaeota archaeon]|jgi:hypothetical protein|nr:hypothetical protein [Candidatus Woesearchaeota archaeon]MDP6647847.1 hypothetical protein [Candidatus Woesearchaeota archaeon]|tara:strand:- start:20025 stop:20273 length:249 start_codon:yes stop_codon:yes gene_type:complete